MIVLRSGTTVWNIKRTDSTNVTSGELKPGSQVTITFSAADGQKKE
jgi:hypothetical protein